MFGRNRPEPTPEPTPETEASAADPQAETIAALEARVAHLTGLLDRVVDANRKTAEERADALVKSLIHGCQIVPAQAGEVRSIFLALLKDPDGGAERAESYARSLQDGPGHGWTTEHVLPGQQHRNAAMGGLQGLQSNAPDSPLALPGGRSVLDPSQGTEAVGGRPDADRLRSILATIPVGQAALARLKDGALDVERLRQTVGLK